MSGIRSRTRGLTGGSDFRFAIITFALLFLLCSVLALSTPIGSSPDEPVQIVRAAGVVRGDPGGAMTEIPSPAPGVPNTVNYFVRVPRDYAEVLSQPNCYAFHPDISASCAPSLPADAHDVEASTYVGSYPPAYYFLVGLPSLVLPAGKGVYAMRLVSALLACSLLALGLVCARRAGGGVLVAASALVITPMALYLGGTVNPSGVEIAAAFATWMATIDLLRHRPSTLVPPSAAIWRFTVATGALVLTRPSGMLITAVIAVTAIVGVSSRARIVALVKERTARVAAAVLVTLGAITLAWVAYARSFGTFVGTPIPGLTAGDVITHTLTSHTGLLRQMVGVFGWLDAVLPDPAWWAWGAAVGVVILAGFVVADRQLKVGMLVAVLLGVIAPPMTQITNAERYGYIWSGRYQLPFAMGVVILAGLAISRYVSAQQERSAAGTVSAPPSVRAAQVGSVVIGALVATTLAVSYVVIVQRFATGVVSGRFDYLDHAQWHPRLDPVLGTLAFCVVAALWGAWIALNGVSGIPVVTEPTRPDET